MTGSKTSSSPVVLSAIGGPTAILEIGGLRLLTDPTFSPPGDYVSGSGAVLTKSAGPALSADEIGPIDIVLLSHDEHADNLDPAGRAVLESAGLVLTTAGAAGRLGGRSRDLGVWETVDAPHSDGGALRVTGAPALHGPKEFADRLVDVRGFVLSGDGIPTIYVSGDNASLDLVREIGERLGPVEIAVLFAGAAQVSRLPNANLTLGSADAAAAARILGVRAAAPLHFSGWTHFTEDADDLRRAFAAAGLADRLILLAPGESAVL
ncbi:MAG TPA: MBL fold metallo-hydrolase [Thermomicrobiales bacterium]|nr:MBL fold metallo-hydrolase [Thermomicrobiales bacterium]